MRQKLATTYYCPKCFDELIEVETPLHGNLVCTECLLLTCTHNALTKQQVGTAKRRHAEAQRN